MDVAKGVQGLGLVVVVGAIPADVNGPLIAGDGLLMVAAPVMDVAEGVPHGSLPAALARLPDLGQRPLSAGKGLLIVAQHGVAVADVGQDQRLPGAVARRAEQLLALMERSAQSERTMNLPAVRIPIQRGPGIHRLLRDVPSTESPDRSAYCGSGHLRTGFTRVQALRFERQTPRQGYLEAVSGRREPPRR